MMKFDWASTLFGCVLFSCYFLLNNSIGFEIKIILQSLMVWFLIFRITGLFNGMEIDTLQEYVMNPTRPIGYTLFIYL